MRFGTWCSRVMGAVAFAVLAMSGAGCDPEADTSELSIAGSYTDGFGGQHAIASDLWVQTSDFGSGPVSSTFHLTRHDNAERWVVGQNDEGNAYNPAKWSRFDWATVATKLYFCQTAYDAASEASALAVTAADPTDPTTAGCGGFAWTELTPVTP